MRVVKFEIFAQEGAVCFDQRMAGKMSTFTKKRIFAVMLQRWELPSICFEAALTSVSFFLRTCASYRRKGAASIGLSLWKITFLK